MTEPDEDRDESADWRWWFWRFLPGVVAGVILAQIFTLRGAPVWLGLICCGVLGVAIGNLPLRERREPKD